MEKVLLLTRSNFRKNKGSSIALFLLILISAALIGVSLIIFFDAYPTARKEAERLDSGDGYIFVAGSIDGFDEESISEAFDDDVTRYAIRHCLGYTTASVPFGNGRTALTVIVDDASVFTDKMDRAEVVIEDSSITEDYIYLPYQFNTSGGYEIGDEYSFELLNTSYNLTVRGFINTTNFGCNNTGFYEFIFDDENFKAIWDKDREVSESLIINYELKPDVSVGRFKIRIGNELLSYNSDAVINVMITDDVVVTKSFMALILAVAFLVMTIIIVLVVIMMLANAISNYIKENFKTIGALKAIGYTSRDIKISLHAQFLILAVIGSLAGIITAYALMPLFSKIIIGQMGVPYNISFNASATFVPVAFEIIFICIVTACATRKIGSIHPIVALRDGTEAHNFKKNHVRLDRSSLGLNMSLAFKTLCTNVKQNIITFIITGAMVFSCVLGLLMYENFSRHPKLEILSFETCAGVVAVETDVSDEVLVYMQEREDLSNIRRIINLNFNYKDEDRLLTYICDDISRLNNKDVCYKGRFPEHDNEAAVSGKFAKLNGLEIGDEIELVYGDKSYKYLITGLLQTCNNSGREALLSQEAASHLVNLELAPTWYWYDLTDESGDTMAASQKILDEVSERYGEHVVSTLNFYEVMEGSMTTFKTISAMMLILMCVISAMVITLTLYMLIKALIYHKRKDYGIYKALGYTSGSLMLQTAISFMPAIILSVVVFSFFSYFIANAYMGLIMYAFGLMKCNFVIPVGGVVIIGCGMVLLSFAIAMWQAGRVKKIEAYNMLVGE